MVESDALAAVELPSVELAAAAEEETDDEELGFPEAYAMVPMEEEDDDDESQEQTIEEEVASAVAVVAATKKRRRRRFFGRVRGKYVRVSTASWWTECKNIETSGCSFALGYMCLSFVLMTLMFNMREIVGDYMLGNAELKKEEYRENIEKAMELRRRNPFSADEENRFEKELAADLYYDNKGQTAGDTQYFMNHRVPIILREDEFEEEEFDDP